MFPLKSITALLFKWEEMVPRLKRVTMSTYQGILVINYARELLFFIIINKKITHFKCFRSAKLCIFEIKKHIAMVMWCFIHLNHAGHLCTIANSAFF